MPSLFFGQTHKKIKGGKNSSQVLFSYRDTGGRSSNGRCKLVAIGDVNCLLTNMPIRIRYRSWFS